MRTPSRRHSLPALTPLAASIALALAPMGASATTWVVSNNNDSGAGSLRQAISDASFDCDEIGNTSQTIVFSAPFVIAPATQLPSLACTRPGFFAFINGYSEPSSFPNSSSAGFDANITVVLDGTTSVYGGYGGTGLIIDDLCSGSAPTLAVAGLEVRNWSTGIAYNGSCGTGSVIVGGNRIVGNSTGILIGNASQVGDGSLQTRNVFGNNSNTAIEVSQGGSNSITGNLIGTLDGSTASPNSDGIDWYADGGSVTNNVISGNQWDAVYIGGAGVNVSGNMLGTDSTGTVPLGNYDGVYLDFSYGNTITNNVISGNLYGGVVVYDDFTCSPSCPGPASSITNNKIGTDISGTVPLGNGAVYGGPGIYMDNSAVSITSNTIAANAGGGIYTEFDTGSNIFGNYIGTNSARAAGLGNNGQGVYAYQPSGLQVVNNEISGNSSSGVIAYYSSGTLVKDNTIGRAGLGNGGGVVAWCGSGFTLQDNVIRANSGLGYDNYGQDGGQILFNTIDANTATGMLFEGGNTCFPQTGSNNAVTQNNVTNNLGDGIGLMSGTGNNLSANIVFGNAGKNIDINANPSDCGVSNDAGDGDIGPNNQQNCPIITSVTQDTVNSNTTITFNLDGGAGGPFRIDAFSNAATDGQPTARNFAGTASGLANGTGLTMVVNGLQNYLSLTATDSAGNTSELSPIQALAATPNVNVSPTSLNFGQIPMGATSAPQTVTVTSTGNAAYQITTFDTSNLCYGSTLCGGAFLCSTTCAPNTPYATNASCVITAQFSPNFVGVDSTTVYICDNAAGSPRSVTLSGQGVVPPPLVSGPTPFDFGSVPVGQTSTPNRFGFLNNGTVSVEIGFPITTGDFAMEATDCGAALGPGSSCTATVTFRPTQAGLLTGQLILPKALLLRGKALIDVAGPPAAGSIDLSGTGTIAAVLQAPDSINLGAYTVGNSAITQTVTLTNTGNAVMTIASITETGPFAIVSNNCPINLSPGDDCTVVLGFASSTSGTITGSLNVASNATGGTRNIPITALAQRVAVPLLHVAPLSLGFGDRMIGSGTATQRVTVTNDGGATATINPLSISIDFLISTTSCGATLEPGASCFADVSFRPLGFGPRSGSLTVNGNDADSPHIVNLGGAGCRPFMVGRGVSCAP